MKNIKTDILWRVFLVYLVMLVFGAAIIIKVVYIQFVEGKELKQKAEEQSLRYFNIEAVRGNICAADGSLLATSVPIFDIRMDVASTLISNAYFQNHIDALTRELSKLFNDKSKYQYKKSLLLERKNGNRYYLIKRNVTYEQLKKLRDFPIFIRGKYRGGLIIIPKTKRKKPFGLLAERTIGYENKNENLYVGVEGAFSEYLSGRNGKQLRRRINNGDWVPVFDENEVEPENGNDIITTIDLNVQDVAESALYNHLIEHQAEWGCAVLMEVETGQIKAIANLTKDPKSNSYKETYNYAVGTSIEPGSTFKLASMLVLLEDDKINLEDTIDIGKGYTVYHGLTIKDVHGVRDGRVSKKEVFTLSLNTGVSRLVYNAYLTNPQKYINRLYDMSINQKSGINIPGEGEPLIKNTKNRSWSKVSLPFMSIGYELRMTPMQLLTFYNAVANNGKMVKPMFVKEIRQAGKTIKIFDTEVINKSICSDATIEKAHELLEGVVESGTAQSLNKSVYKIAGKTGTAQIADLNKGYDKTNYNASFVGYFPADNPKYSCIVVVSKPSTGRYYASSVAVPVFKEIADKVYATDLEIHQHKETEPADAAYPVYATGYQEELKYVYQTLDIPLDSLSTNAEWAIALKADSTVRLETRIIKEGLVPNVKGMGAKDAVYVLENLGLKVKIHGRGFVREQSLSPGSRVKKGNMITLKLAV
ncbi:MAG: transpeptidase family protein [Bacteroidetes bacterium]|nr:transpeptidase family protein [Bacteroidota bacterium]MBL7102799.1 transpeptidase family protein [Bacteroidales bacterium]